MNFIRRQWLALFFSSTILIVFVKATTTQSTQGLINLLKRRLPAHVDDFEFQIQGNHTLGVTHDEYVVSQTVAGKILIEGNSISGIASGLRKYFTDILHVDIWWYIGSQLHLAPESFPTLNSTLKGSSIVPWRYHFNTVTFSYQAAFWTWEDWELQLDWMSLHGINLSLAWVGYEKTLLTTLLTIGLTTDEILSFFSGPAFQAWNRFGNIQGSWGGTIPLAWIEDQHLLQKNIVRRMVELGITPALPAFTGFAPRELRRVAPDANIINGSDWGNLFPVEYSNDTFLYPTDPLFTTLQHTFLNLQSEYYGNISHVYTLDQFNENTPASGDLIYLGNISRGTYESLQSFDPNAIWMLQGWLFYADSSFWTRDRVEAYLGGVSKNESMLILDLFSESFPEWENTNQYYGKPWIWCQVRGYGGTVGVYGQIYNITNSSIEALRKSDKMVGMGNTMEGQDGNGLMYELILDQAWNLNSIDTESYFKTWVAKRYHTAGYKELPSEAYSAWEILRTTAYNNTNLTLADSLPKSLLETQPNISENHGRLGQSLTIDLYNPADLFRAWRLLCTASVLVPELWDDDGWQFDMVDITREVLAERFKLEYVNLIQRYRAGIGFEGTTKTLIGILQSLDSVLSTSPHFRLDTWVNAAIASSPDTSTYSSLRSSHNSSISNLTQTQHFFAYNAINQITIWGPAGVINDYASKSWGGLVRGYYLKRWKMFFDYIGKVGFEEFNATEVARELGDFELGWQWNGWVGDLEKGNGDGDVENDGTDLRDLIENLIKEGNGKSNFN
ncbi:putative alpha-n- protein [Botrytis fragariae]|uniref:Putative alpha-n- protein n=1 Tax=Botrytis fragariae TaxID=1964551 RepID=A0A8H6EDY0_9HELO|nr:putative alpha-n- protein [Botrytis fragariae]KAF5868365.1 putative alpha-n- protein [Botrytis fragariae]